MEVTNQIQDLLEKMDLESDWQLAVLGWILNGFSLMQYCTKLYHGPRPSEQGAKNKYIFVM